MTVIQLLINFALLLSIDCYIIEPGPAIIATKGEVWPKPQRQNKSDDFYVVRGSTFQFQFTTNVDCKILQDAVTRYQKIISIDYQMVENNLKYDNHQNHKKGWLQDKYFAGYLDSLNVSLLGSCNDQEYPALDMKEEYTLNLASGNAELSANSTWGVLRGLETFVQLMYLGDDSISLRINATYISDFPRFSHRGLLLDTSRHFLPLDKILTTLDALACNKMNVFHWHIVDDQSFPYVSKKFPDLSAKGAYQSSKVYTPSDVQEVIEYARQRGIRVLAEFDSPGHTRSWGVADRDLLTECYNDNNQKTGQLGPIDPTKNATYSFLREFFSEIVEVFPDQYVHLGGDEVDFECWKSNPDIKKFMEALNMTDNYVDLESYYIQKLIDIVDELNSSSIVWQEVFVNGVQIPDETIVHVWIMPWELTMFAVTHSGKPALLSACWYLDSLESGGDWQDFYNCDPYNFGGTDIQKQRIIGGEACMWAEVVNEYNVISRVWPRASSAAEKLWSDQSVNDITEASRRLEEHTCRMNRRGIGAQPPTGPGYCP